MTPMWLNTMPYLQGFKNLGGIYNIILLMYATFDTAPEAKQAATTDCAKCAVRHSVINQSMLLYKKKYSLLAKILLL